MMVDPQAVKAEPVQVEILRAFVPVMEETVAAKAPLPPLIVEESDKGS